MADKKPYSDLEALLEDCPERGSRWRHYKTGNIYTVTGNAIQEATGEPLVLYLPHGQTVQMARPLAEWEETVEQGRKKVARFTRVDG